MMASSLAEKQDDIAFYYVTHVLVKLEAIYAFGATGFKFLCTYNNVDTVCLKKTYLACSSSMK